MKKKLWLLLLTTLMCLALASAVGAETLDDYTYEILDNEAVITDVETTISGSVTVPSVIDGFPVTAIGNNAFQNCTAITELTLPEGIVTIGKYAFSGCTKMTAISIPYGVTSIGNYAFYDCSTLEDISLPGSVTSIGSYVFRNCDGLTDVIFPKGIPSIGSYAFYDCDGLTNVVIPDGVTVIAEYTFFSCRELKNVTLPDSITSIGQSAFDRCSAMTAITLPKQLTSIGYRAFAGCNSLQSITLPNGVTSIQDYTFQDCYNLTAAVIPASVTSISSYAFRDSKNIPLSEFAIYGYTGSYAQTYAQKENIPFYSLEDIAKPVFVTNLADASYFVGDSAYLSVLANAAFEGTITYQWYVSDTADGEGTAIDGATKTSCALPTQTTYVKYYYVIAANTNGTHTVSAKSNVAKITVLEAPAAETPVIFAQTSSSACRAGEETLLFVSASVSDGGALSYQWYVSDTEDGEGTAVNGAVSAAYKPSTAENGTKYYYVLVTNTSGKASASVKSDVMAISVGTGYITGDVNASGETDADDSRILAQYFAGYPVDDEFTNPAAADIDSSGELTRRDAGVLARYLDKWVEYSVRINYSAET